MLLVLVLHLPPLTEGFPVMNSQLVVGDLRLKGGERGRAAAFSGVVQGAVVGLPLGRVEAREANRHAMLARLGNGLGEKSRDTNVAAGTCDRCELLELALAGFGWALMRAFYRGGRPRSQLLVFRCKKSILFETRR